MATQIRIITVGAEGYGTVWVRLVGKGDYAIVDYISGLCLDVLDTPSSGADMANGVSLATHPCYDPTNGNNGRDDHRCRPGAGQELTRESGGGR